MSIWKKIKKYKRLRSSPQAPLQTDILKDLYKKADSKLRKEYEAEMDAYINAVESGRVKAGEPLEHLKSNDADEL